MTEVFADNAQLRTRPSSAVTTPASGTSEVWTVRALSSAWPVLSAGQTMSIVDPSEPSEIIRITASSGPGATQIVVTRGADSTTPIRHLSDAVFVSATVASDLNSFGQSGTTVPTQSAAGFDVWMPSASGDLTGVQDTAAYASLQTLLGFGPGRIRFRTAPNSAPYYMNGPNSIFGGQLVLGQGEEATYVSPGSSSTSNLLFESNTSASGAIVPTTAFTNLVGQFVTTGPTGFGMCDMTIEAGVHQVGTLVPDVAPGAVTIAQGGTPGSTTYFYKIEWTTNNSAYGTHVAFSNSVPSIAVTTTGAATLSVTNFNTLTLPSAPSGANGVRISRSTTGGTGNYTVVYWSGVITSFNDTVPAGTGSNLVPSWVNGTAGTVVGFYGQQMLCVNLRIRSALGLGLWTEWAPTGNDAEDSNQMESMFLNVKINDCGGTGWYNNGSHDSSVVGAWISNNAQTDSNESQYIIGPSGPGCTHTATHCWGNQSNYGVVCIANGVKFDTTCQLEDSTLYQFWALGTAILLNGELFQVGTNTSGGLRIGHAVGGSAVSSAGVIADFATANLGGTAVFFDDDAGSTIRVTGGSYASLFTGTPNAATIIDMPRQTITRRTSQDVGANAAAATVSASYAAATVAGDLLIAYCEANTAPGTLTITGWTKLADIQAGSSTISAALFCKLADGTETSVTCTAAAATAMYLFITEFTGNANPIVVDASATAANVSGSASAMPAITTKLPGDLILSFAGSSSTLGAVTVPWQIGQAVAMANVTRAVLGQYVAPGVVTRYQDRISWTSSVFTGEIVAAFAANIPAV